MTCGHLLVLAAALGETVMRRQLMDQIGSISNSAEPHLYLAMHQNIDAGFEGENLA